MTGVAPIHVLFSFYFCTFLISISTFLCIAMLFFFFVCSLCIYVQCIKLVRRGARVRTLGSVKVKKKSYKIVFLGNCRFLCTQFGIISEVTILGVMDLRWAHWYLPIHTVVINHVILSDYRSCNCISKFLVFGLCFSFKKGMSKMSSWFSNLVKNFLQIQSNFLGEFDLKIWWKTKSRNHDQDILKIKSIYNSEMVCLKCLVDLHI